MAPERQGEIAATISNSIVGIFADSYGRGPTKAKTYLVDDYVVTVLEDILTTQRRPPSEASRVTGRGSSRS